MNALGCAIISAWLAASAAAPSPVAPRLEHDGWLDPGPFRERLEQPIMGPRVRAMMAEKQKALLIVADDRAANYLKVRVFLSHSIVLEQGAFIITTASGRQLHDSGALIALGDPRKGVHVDTSKGPQRLRLNHQEKGRMAALVRFTGERERVVSVALDPERWRSSP